MSTIPQTKEAAILADDTVLVLGYAEQLRVFGTAWRISVLTHLHQIEDGPLYVQRIVGYLEEQARAHYILAANSGGHTSGVYHTLAQSYGLCAEYVRSFITARDLTATTER